MNTHTNHPIVWDEEISAYVYSAQGYNGPSTKKTGRIASVLSLEHFKVRQLELIVRAITEQKTVNHELEKQLSNRIKEAISV